MEEGYIKLQCAIVQQAIKDFKKALRQKNAAHIQALERWFLSPWGQRLSENNGARIIAVIKQEVERASNGRKQN